MDLEIRVNIIRDRLEEVDNGYCKECESWKQAGGLCNCASEDEDDDDEEDDWPEDDDEWDDEEDWDDDDEWDDEEDWDEEEDEDE